MTPRPRLLRRRVATAAALTLAVAGGAQATAVRASAPAAPDEHVMITFGPGVDSDEVRAELVAGAGTAALEPIGLRSFRLPVAAGGVPHALRLLNGRGPGLVAEPDGRVSVTVAPDDDRYPDQWWASNAGRKVDNLWGTPGADVDAQSAWATTTGDPSVVVAVVDTGIDDAHPDLRANLWTNPGTVGACPGGTHGFDVIGNDCDPDDGHFHGTHVAGIIGAQGNNGSGVAGVTWKVQLMGLRALDSAGVARESDVVKAIHWAVEAKRAGVNLRVINASWGTESYSQALADEVAWAGDNDILVVAAAGNGGADGVGDDDDATAMYPCAFPAANVVCVANTNSHDELEESSNFGSRNVDLAAPGTGVLSTVPTHSHGYDFFSGTSMAAPMVTGAAALAASQGPISAADLRQRLLAAVDPIPALDGLVASGGRLNLCKAVSGCAPLHPGNDSLASAVDLTGSNGRRGTTRGATMEPGEPGHGPFAGPGDGSVWFSLKAPEGSLRLSANSPGGLGLAVYNGPGAGQLTPVGTGEGAAGHLVTVTVPVTRADKYWVAVTGRSGLSGPYTLLVDTAAPGAALPAPKPVVPAVVRSLSAAPGEGSAALAWAAPANGGSPITGYGVRVYRDGLAVQDVAVDPGQNRVTLAGLDNGSAYAFRVWAKNAAGHGLLSAPSAPVVPGTAAAAGDSLLPAPPGDSGGYWMLDAGGRVYGFGDALHQGDPSAALTGAGLRRAVDLEPNPAGPGYWVVDDDGRVFAYGDALLRSGGTPPEAGRAVSLSATPSGRGYWLFTDRGWAVPFGDATHLGDLRDRRLNAPVLDSIPTPGGRGYYMVAADGGIFAFGDAAFHGSMGGVRLNAPVQSLVPDRDGAGYWLVASDGGVFAFDAPYRGSMGGQRLNRPVTGMVRFGDGYLMVGEDGGVFNFSDRPFYGSLGATPPPQPVVAIAALER